MYRLEYRHVTMDFPASKGAETVAAIADVNFSIADGEVVSLIGPSGCGKSTLLNIGSGLYPPTKGQTFVDGEPVEGPSAHVAFMLQKDLLLPWRTIRENVMFGVQIQRHSRAECRRRADNLLANFHLDEFANRYPNELSGGMRQRVALARTLAVDPTVLLLDEPFSAIDAQTRIVLQRDLALTLKRAGKTALLITHDLLEAVTLADRVLVMSRRPGRIIDEIKIEIPDREDPIKRRRHPSVEAYVQRLMDRLRNRPRRMSSVSARTVVRRGSTISLLLLVVFVAMWEWGFQFLGVPSFIVPPASAVVKEGIRMWQVNHLLLHTGVTAGEVVAGFIIGSLLGAAIGYLLGMSATAEFALSPYILALQIAPKVAFAPLFILWMGFYGLSKNSGSGADRLFSGVGQRSHCHPLDRLRPRQPCALI